MPVAGIPTRTEGAASGDQDAAAGCFAASTSAFFSAYSQPSHPSREHSVHGLFICHPSLCSHSRKQCASDSEQSSQGLTY